ncbi:uncharacterized protein LOC128550307 [Mercenaria mercenaria]|uniref:uncharacterized protein LOC128550307 n=1 Tax=Mercenaria mercenaria TaxID=6596 RepID=UPI00234F04A5|nr:uncharacterized protein LOC128550307 [Mercenaria mercenaria]
MELLGKVIGVFCIAAFIPVCCRAQYRNLNDSPSLRRIFKTLSIERHASQGNQQAEPESQPDYGKSHQGSRMLLSAVLGFGGLNEVARHLAQSQSQPVYRRTRQAIHDDIEDKWDDNKFDDDNDDDNDDDDIDDDNDGNNEDDGDDSKDDDDKSDNNDVDSNDDDNDKDNDDD